MVTVTFPAGASGAGNGTVSVWPFFVATTGVSPTVTDFSVICPILAGTRLNVSALTPSCVSFVTVAVLRTLSFAFAHRSVADASYVAESPRLLFGVAAFVGAAKTGSSASAASSTSKTRDGAGKADVPSGGLGAHHGMREWPRGQGNRLCAVPATAGQYG